MRWPSRLGQAMETCWRGREMRVDNPCVCWSMRRCVFALPDAAPSPATVWFAMQAIMDIALDADAAEGADAEQCGVFLSSSSLPGPCSLAWDGMGVRGVQHCFPKPGTVQLLFPPKRLTDWQLSGQVPVGCETCVVTPDRLPCVVTAPVGERRRGRGQVRSSRAQPLTVSFADN